MGATVSNGIVAFARVVGAICRDAADFLVLRDLTEKIGQNRRIADMTPCDLDSPDLQRFLVNSEVNLAPDTPLGTTMFASVPLNFTLDLDPSAINQKVQWAAGASIRLVSGTISPRGSMELALDPATLAQELDLPADALHPDLAMLSTRFDRRRRGQEAKLIVGTPTPAPDARLLHTLSKALSWAEAIRSGTSLGTIAAQERQQIAFIRSRLRLAFLSPRIQRAIRDGTQPPELCLERIIRNQVPLRWDEQERRYGFT